MTITAEASAAVREVAPASGPRPSGHPAVQSGNIGVLLMNLGTPDATDYWSMRRYLREFLSDRRVIELPRALWWPLLNLVILQTRPGRKGKDYASIWNKDRNEGPLKTITRAQADKLGALLAGGRTRIVVDWAMRYANPTVASRLAYLQSQGCDRILAVPLYPQYAGATTGTACDKVFEALMTMRWQPTLRVAPPYYDQAVYIEALARSLQSTLKNLDFEPEMILASFHGMPVAYLHQGDPYYCHCMKTARLLRHVLDLSSEKFQVSFQSLFGKAEWLRPYTADTIKAFGRKGLKRLVVITPGFSADCLETIEEISVENAGYFRANGGTHFAHVPCLNDSPPGMRMIQTLVENELSGWL